MEGWTEDLAENICDGWPQQRPQCDRAYPQQMSTSVSVRETVRECMCVCVCGVIRVEKVHDPEKL